MLAGGRSPMLMRQRRQVARSTICWREPSRRSVAVRFGCAVTPVSGPERIQGGRIAIQVGASARGHAQTMRVEVVQAPPTELVPIHGSAARLIYDGERDRAGIARQRWSATKRSAGRTQARDATSRAARAESTANTQSPRQHDFRACPSAIFIVEHVSARSVRAAPRSRP